MLGLRELSELVSLVTDPSSNPFYREFYGLPSGSPPLLIRTLAEWEALPFLTKDALIVKKLAERTFIPLSELDHIRASSGTSGKPPLFSPRTHVRNMEYRLRFHDFKRPFLAFTVPLMPHWHESFQKEHGGHGRVICYDPRYPKASAMMARDVGVDAFSVFVYHVRDLGEAMRSLGTNLNIRYIEVTGEVCSQAQLRYMKATFPNAVVIQSYNSSEVEDAHMGMPCRPLTEDDPVARYHPKGTHYLELMDPASGAVVPPHEGAEGDLLVTTYPGKPASFPLLRFRIGDTVRIVEDACAEHGQWSFTVAGRTDMDFVKIPGGVIRADEIARVLTLFRDRVSDRFELHCVETLREDGPRFTPRLHVELNSSHSDLHQLANDIARALRVSPGTTYAEGAALGRYAPLECAPLTVPSSGKLKRIVWE